MSRLRPLPVFALAAWSLFLWTSRLGLAWENEPTLGRKLLATLPVAIFVTLGIAMVAVLARRSGAGRGDELTGRARLMALGFAAWTIAYWVVRTPIILVDPHGAAFKAVHAVLALVSVVLGVVAARSVGTRHRPAAA